jgi:hypothetical protein
LNKSHKAQSAKAQARSKAFSNKDFFKTFFTLTVQCRRFLLTSLSPCLICCPITQSLEANLKAEERKWRLMFAGTCVCTFVRPRCEYCLKKLVVLAFSAIKEQSVLT